MNRREEIEQQVCNQIRDQVWEQIGDEIWNLICAQLELQALRGQVWETEINSRALNRSCSRVYEQAREDCDEHR